MEERVPGHATGAEVLGGQHAPSSQDTDERVEGGLLGVDALVERLGEGARAGGVQVHSLGLVQQVVEVLKVGLGRLTARREEATRQCLAL